MSKVCEITGKKAITGNNVSHSKRRTKRKFNVNVFNRKFYWVEQQTWIRLTVSAAGLRIINRIGLDAALKKAGKEIAKFLSGAGSEGEKSATIDKLLIGFSDADKFVIMKYAFLGMC